MRINDIDYISLTDLAKYSNPENPANVIIHWMSNKGTFDYIGLWEQLNNENFNFTEFSEIKNKEVGYTSFTLSPKRWIDRTNAIGIYSKGGKYSLGTFAHPDIAFEFASWLSPEFKLYLIKEFERLKSNEMYQQKIEWHANRLLSKLNYVVHTDAVKNYIVPTLTEEQKRFVYAELIEMKIPQNERLVRLNNIARKQMELLKNNKSFNNLEYIENKVNNKQELPI